MSDYSAKVHHDVGGDQLTVDPGGSIQIGNAKFTVNAAGKLVVTGLQTTDPHTAGQLWSNNGVLTLSAG